MSYTHDTLLPQTKKWTNYCEIQNQEFSQAKWIKMKKKVDAEKKKERETPQTEY